jgi:hypothetical protein
MIGFSKSFAIVMFAVSVPTLLLGFSWAAYGQNFYFYFGSVLIVSAFILAGSATILWNVATITKALAKTATKADDAAITSEHRKLTR